MVDAWDGFTPWHAPITVGRAARGGARPRYDDMCDRGRATPAPARGAEGSGATYDSSMDCLNGTCINGTCGKLSGTLRRAASVPLGQLQQTRLPD
jgi:hypothetical protein